MCSMAVPVKWVVSAAVLAAAVALLRKVRRGKTVRQLEKQLPPRSLFKLVNAVFNRMPVWRNRIVPPQLAVLSFAGGFFNSKALHVVLKLRVPDQLHSGPVSIEELAKKCGARADRLGRIVRLLNSNGFFEYKSDGRSRAHVRWYDTPEIP